MIYNSSSSAILNLIKIVFLQDELLLYLTLWQRVMLRGIQLIFFRWPHLLGSFFYTVAQVVSGQGRYLWGSLICGELPSPEMLSTVLWALLLQTFQSTCYFLHFWWDSQQKLTENLHCHVAWDFWTSLLLIWKELRMSQWWGFFSVI